MTTHSAHLPPRSLIFPFLLLPLLAVLTHPLRPTAQRTGLTLDRCTTPEQCRDPRVCVAVSPSSPLTRLSACQPTSPFCVCHPLRLGDDCKSDFICSRGERCVRPSPAISPSTLCASCQASRLNTTTLPPVQQSDSQICPPNTEGSLTGVPCREDIECEAPRFCSVLRRPTQTAFGQLCRDSNCVCRPSTLVACNACSKCPEGEHCTVDPTDTNRAFCTGKGIAGFVPVEPIDDATSCSNQSAIPSSSPFATRTATPSPSAAMPTSTPTPSPLLTLPSPSSRAAVTPGNDNGASSGNNAVCIGVAHLSNIPIPALVFPTHRRAWVLCDQWESCATAGHVVIVEGGAMMMRRYCEEVKIHCSWHRMWVNSPRVVQGSPMARRGDRGWRVVRVKSRSPGLVFTGFAARFETRVEEVALRALVRVGW